MIFNFQTPFGEVAQRETNDYLVKKPGYKVSPSAPEKFKITVQYAGTAPQLKAIRLNAKEVCPAPAAVDTAGLTGLASPCPFIFSYNPPGPEKDTWTGVLTLSSDAELTGIYSRINFDKSPLEVTVGQPLRMKLVKLGAKIVTVTYWSGVNLYFK